MQFGSPWTRPTCFRPGLYLQNKLPLENPILQSLSAVDPILRGHSQAVIHLKKLATNLQHFTDPESDVHLEIVGYSVSPDLASFSEGEDMVTWLAKVFNSQKFPALSKVVKAALSIFHGPLVEASFNLMGDIIDPKSSNMAIPTFNAFQTVKYTLKSGNMSATQIFKRDDPKYGKLDQRLCQNIKSAGARDAARRQKNRISAMERAKEYGYEKAQTAEDSKRAALKAEKRARMKHAAKQRRRALEILVAKKKK